jgi:hypothetical protein
LADITKQLIDCQVALAEQGKLASAAQVQKTDLKERLRYAEQKAIDVERELLQFKENTSENLKRHASKRKWREEDLLSQKRGAMYKRCQISNVCE